MENKEKTIVITGAAGGIGKALTTRFLEDGCRVCAVDLSNEVLDKLREDLKSPGRLFYVATDISSEESCHNLYSEINKKWGTLDVLVNNAGWFPIIDFEDITYTDWKKVIAVNLDGTFLMTKALLPLLKKSTAGKIVNVSSGSFFNPPANQAHYVSAKAGVIGFTRVAAVALGKYNITVNAITPGLTATPKVVDNFPSDMIDKESQDGALKRRQVANDLVGAIVFLSSDDAGFITGQTINIDGGRSFI
jgi:NAD(P)-dependent dehydrogenase (short-subunit alcohol dehydrogenase family)